MTAIAFSGWPAALAQAVFIATCVAVSQAAAQIGLNDSFDTLPSYLSDDPWSFTAAATAQRRKTLRLEEWAEVIAGEVSSSHSPQSHDGRPLVADRPSFRIEGALSALSAEQAAASEASLGLEELRGSLRNPEHGKRERKHFADRLLSDQLNFYSPDSLLAIGGGLAAGGLMANTSLDRNIHRHLQSSLRNANTDEWMESLHANKELGDGTLTLPIFGAAWIAGSLLPDSRGSRAARVWGENSLRGFLVGAPPLLALQLATGGSRPGETVHGSEWQPFHDDNGVSGHSFMGALPFITAAQMTDSVAWKTAFYAASTLAPLSRAADGAHYPSQIALGWWMAFVSASAVHATEHPDSRWHLYPTTIAGGSGMALEYRF